MLLSLYCGTQIALPFYQGHIIDYVSTGNNDGFISHIEMYIGIMAAQGLLSALYSAVFAVVSRRLVFHVRNTLFEQASAVSAASAVCQCLLSVIVDVALDGGDGGDGGDGVVMVVMADCGARCCLL